ncbi:MAG: hypothetical protein ABI791_10465 [Acidobacteriota bacterium]
MNAHDQLESDHTELDRLLENIFEAIDGEDCTETYRRLDFFWARLAMHIRAEHLRLFPAVLQIGDSHLQDAGSGEVPADLVKIIDGLHDDHDFFMRSLARAIKAMRLVFDFGNEKETLAIVREMLEGVQGRLVPHNRIEEDQIYPLASGKLLRTEDLDELSRTVRKELDNLPHRFAADQGTER